MATSSQKLTGSALSLEKYFEERRPSGLEDYYRGVDSERRGDGVLFGEVWGKFAERLGLTELTRAQFRELVEGYWNGERLVGPSRLTKMIDNVYAAPKSLAVYMVLCEDDATRRGILDDLKAAVWVGFDSMQEHARVARVPVRTPTEAGVRTVQHGERAGEESRMQGSSTDRVEAEMIAMPVVQLTARPTEESIARGYEVDPHLHVHYPIMAVVAVPDRDNPDQYRTYTPDDLGIKRQAEEREYVIRTELGRRLEERGIALEYHHDAKGRTSWEVAGIPREARDRFSTNAQRKEKLAQEFTDRRGRPPTRREIDQLLRDTRLPKSTRAKEMDERGAWELWREDLRSAGIGTDPPARSQPTERDDVTDRWTELRDRLLAGDGLHRQDAIVDRDAVRTAIARCAVDLGLTPEELRTFERRFSDELVVVRDARLPEYVLYAHPSQIEAEVLVAVEIDLRATSKISAPSWNAVHKAIHDADVRLDAEQRAAVKAMCAPTAWANLIGRAGTGKTTVLRTVGNALRDSGMWREPQADRVIVVSTSTITARRSAEEIGADRGYSVQGFVMAVEKGLRLTERTWLLVDEAVMAHPMQSEALRSAAGPAVIHTRPGPAADQIIVVSTSAITARRSAEAIGADRGYSIEGFAKAVELGLEVTDRTWVFIDEAAMVDTPRMRKLFETAGPAVIRAIGDDRQLTPIGPAGWYADQLERHGGTELTRVHRQRDAADARDFTDLGAGKVEQAIRALDERGRIYQLDDAAQRARAAVHLYRAERERGRSATDVIVAVDGSNHQVDELNRRIQRERLDMEEIGGDPLRVRATDDDRSWSLYRGDRVVFRERTVDIADDVIRNGTFGEITEIIGRLVEVRLEDGRTVLVQLRAESHTQPIVPAYAAHVSTFQGGQAKAVIVVPGRQGNRHTAYTAVTRAVEDVHIVIDKETFGERPLETLVRDWSRTSDRRTAWSQLDAAQRQRWRDVVDGRRDAVDPEAEARRERNADAAQRDDPARVVEPDAEMARPDVGADIGQPPRRGPREADATQQDAEEIREALRDLRQAQAGDDEDAAGREAAEGIVTDPDADARPPRFLSLDRIVEEKLAALDRRMDEDGKHRERASREQAGKEWWSYLDRRAEDDDHRDAQRADPTREGPVDAAQPGTAPEQEAVPESPMHERSGDEWWHQLDRRSPSADPTFPPPEPERER